MKGGIHTLEPMLLWTGVTIITIAIFMSAKAYSNLAQEKRKPSIKGVLLAVTGGVFIAFFDPLVVTSLDPSFVSEGKGTLTPYSGVFVFAIGIFVSTFFINPFFMGHPVEGMPVKIKEYFNGSPKTYLTGVLGGAIWILGTK